jgi:hypothetical protein
MRAGEPRVILHKHLFAEEIATEAEMLRVMLRMTIHAAAGWAAGLTGWAAGAGPMK